MEFTNIASEYAADALSRRHRNNVTKITFQSMLSQGIKNSLKKAVNRHINFIYTERNF